LRTNRLNRHQSHPSVQKMDEIRIFDEIRIRLILHLSYDKCNIRLKRYAATQNDIRGKLSHSRATTRRAARCCHLARIGGSRFRHYVTEGFGVGRVGERREEENGRRGYGKRAGTSCEVRVARHEIASLAIDRAKKGRPSCAGEGPTTSLASRSRVPP